MPLGYRELLGFVQSMLPAMRVTRQRNLAAVVLGILQVRDAHLTVSEIARAVPTRSDHWHKFKRIRRFLSNLNWAPDRCFGELLQFVLARFRVGAYLPVIIDQSTIAGKWEVLWASIPFRGRALPFCFKVFRQQELSQTPQGSQPKLEDEFIQMVVQLLPAGLLPVLLLDRGYARVSLVRLLNKLPVKYVIRTRGDTWVYYPKGYEGQLAKFKVRRGELIWWPTVFYHQREHCPTSLAITLNATAAEPWYLLTNLNRAAKAVFWYERRFRCEELFKDLKDQLQLETIRVTATERVERLLFGIIVAYYALTLIGVAAKGAGLAKKVCKDRVSAAWTALRLLRMPQFLKPRFVRRALTVRCWSLSYEESG